MISYNVFNFFRDSRKERDWPVVIYVMLLVFKTNRDDFSYLKFIKENASIKHLIY